MNKNNTKDEPFPWQIQSLKYFQAHELVENWKGEVDVHERKMDSIFQHDKKLGYITINAAYPYHIELNRIPDPEGLVHWLDHLLGKDWMTSDLVREFIRRVYAIKGWDLHRRSL
jgi:hypothetical protein